MTRSLELKVKKGFALDLTVERELVPETKSRIFFCTWNMRVERIGSLKLTVELDLALLTDIRKYLGP